MRVTQQPTIKTNETEENPLVVSCLRSKRRREREGEVTAISTVRNSEEGRERERRRECKKIACVTLVIEPNSFCLKFQ